ncbi:MAG: hypothetical protein K2O64_06475, partial [Lactobacillus sp.]|nr:hypothetical protein [Lactobacillus sp.]
MNNTESLLDEHHIGNEWMQSGRSSSHKSSFTYHKNNNRNSSFGIEMTSQHDEKMIVEEKWHITVACCC